MKAVLISVQPKHCGNITLGIKTIEVRKTKPKLETPFKCYIYCTSSNVHECLMQNEGGVKLIYACNYKTAIPCGGHIANGKVIGEFVCDKFYDIIQYGFGAKVFTDNLETEVEPSEFIKMSCLSEEQIFEYIGNKDGYGWHISDLVIYDKPKELSEFNHCGVNYHFNPPITRPPQSWCYVEELKGE